MKILTQEIKLVDRDGKQTDIKFETLLPQKKCPQCGKPINKDATYCTECLAEIQEQNREREGISRNNKILILSICAVALSIIGLIWSSVWYCTQNNSSCRLASIILSAIGIGAFIACLICSLRARININKNRFWCVKTPTILAIVLAVVSVAFGLVSFILLWF